MGASDHHNVAMPSTGEAPSVSAGPSGATMRAVAHDRYGSPHVLRVRDVDRPAITDDEVLVRVRAAGLHVGGCSGLRRVPSACADYARTKEDKLALTPAGLTFMEAAAVPTSAVTRL
jgi:NADPH:quinone reductase-like Zn-dependent oxidoreductase